MSELGVCVLQHACEGQRTVESICPFIFQGLNAGRQACVATEPPHWPMVLFHIEACNLFRVK